MITPCPPVAHRPRCGAWGGQLVLSTGQLPRAPKLVSSFGQPRQSWNRKCFGNGRLHPRKGNDHSRSRSISAKGKQAPGISRRWRLCTTPSGKRRHGQIESPPPLRRAGHIRSGEIRHGRLVRKVWACRELECGVTGGRTRHAELTRLIDALAYHKEFANLSGISRMAAVVWIANRDERACIRLA